MFLLCISLVCLVFVIRIIYVIWKIGTKGHVTNINESTVKTLIVLGSGGHTGEMLKMITKLDTAKYNPRIYVVADTDSISLRRVHLAEGPKVLGFCLNVTETVIQDDMKDGSDYQIEVIPRTREVGQSWLSTVGTTLWASAFSIAVIARHRPALILTNGPGTCVPLCLAALIFRILGICVNRIVFVESLCRVQSLSLTGRILYRLADDFFVQWEKLKEKYPKAIYMGRLV